jgi:hypothetical protein
MFLDPMKTSLSIVDVEPGDTLKVGTPRVMASQRFQLCVSTGR